MKLPGRRNPNDERTRDSYGRRASDRKWPRHLRDIWMVVITLITLLALHAASDAVDRVQDGRKIGSAITCAVLSAISQEGRHVLTSAQAAHDTELTRFLEQHGYPPLSVRTAEAREAGRLYVKDISDRVQQQVGRRGDGLVLRDGTINCRRLAQISLEPSSRTRHGSPGPARSRALKP